jgi:hypothetical protein
MTAPGSGRAKDVEVGVTNLARIRRRGKGDLDTRN